MQTWLYVRTHAPTWKSIRCRRVSTENKNCMLKKTSIIKWGKTAWSVYAIPYSEKFSLVKNFAKMPPDSSEEVFAVFIFVERMCDALTTPLPVTRHANWRKDTERWSEEACATTACWTERFSTADLNFDNFRAHFFIFVKAGLSTKIKENSHPAKISHYTLSLWMLFVDITNLTLHCFNLISHREVTSRS